MAVTYLYRVSFVSVSKMCKSVSVCNSNVSQRLYVLYLYIIIYGSVRVIYFIF